LNRIFLLDNSRLDVIPTIELSISKNIINFPLIYYPMVMSFICKIVTLEQILKCSFGLNKTEIMVLVTGDGDFVPLLEYLKHQGVTVEVIAFRRSTSAKLIQAADKFYDLEESVERFLLRK